MHAEHGCVGTDKGIWKKVCGIWKKMLKKGFASRMVSEGNERGNLGLRREITLESNTKDNCNCLEMQNKGQSEVQ